jgi:hypothetical protein
MQNDGVLILLNNSGGEYACTSNAGHRPWKIWCA